MKRILALVLTAVFGTVTAPAPAEGALQIIVPGGALFKLELLSPISTATNQSGDKFDCKVLEPAEFAGAIVSGKIHKVKRARKANGTSEMSLMFGKITLSDGAALNFGAQVKEVYDVSGAADQGRADEEGAVKGGKKIHKRDVLKMAVAGAIIGLIFGGPKGAVIGAVAGAAFGTTTVLATKGENLEFKQGTLFTVETDRRR